MIIEIILIVLGIFTICLAFYNLYINAYVWGILFLIGGAWSIWLGIIYLLQFKKEQKKNKPEPENLLISDKETNEIEPETEEIFNTQTNLLPIEVIETEETEKINSLIKKEPIDTEIIIQNLNNIDENQEEDISKIEIDELVIQDKESNEEID